MRAKIGVSVQKRKNSPFCAAERRDTGVARGVNKPFLCRRGALGVVLVGVVVGVGLGGVGVALMGMSSQCI